MTKQLTIVVTGSFRVKMCIYITADKMIFQPKGMNIFFLSAQKHVVGTQWKVLLMSTHNVIFPFFWVFFRNKEKCLEKELFQPKMLMSLLFLHKNHMLCVPIRRVSVKHF